MPDLAEAPVFDVNQLRNICMEDVDLMRELVVSLVDDASSQIPALMDAIDHGDSSRCARLAHYVKGACANVGAVALAALMKSIERDAAAGDFVACRVALGNLNTELQRFSAKTASL